MEQKKRNHSAEFKDRTTLESINGMKSVKQIAADNHLHPVLLTQSKTQMIEPAFGVFVRVRDREKEEAFSERAKKRLESKVSQVAVEVDWLKRCKDLGITP